MPIERKPEPAPVLDRREFFGGLGAGLAGVALTHLLAGDLRAAAPDPSAQGWVPGRPHFEPKARQVLHIFCPGGASNIDLWDYKPALERLDGTAPPGEK